MLIAQFDEVLEIRRPAIDPMPYVVDIGELGVGAAGKPAALVATSDLQALAVARIAACPAQVEAATVGPIG
jgi:hypothetical protein